MAAGIHTAVFVGESGDNTFAALNAQSDGVLGIRNNRLIPTTNMSLLAAAATGATLSGARISTPSTVISPAHIHPYNNNATVPSDPNVLTCVQNPVVMRSGEEITVETQADSAVPAVAVLWLCQQMDPVPPGESYWIRFFLSADTQVFPTGVWTTATFVVFERSSLPSGRYAIVGFDLAGTGTQTGAAAMTLVAARLVLPGEVMRPGALILPGRGATPHRMVEDASLGVLGKFDALLPPAIEIFGVVPAAGTQTYSLNFLDGYLRIIKIA